MTTTFRPMAIPLASGYERNEVDELDDPVLAAAPCIDHEWRAYSWDCPGCGSLLLAIAQDTAVLPSSTDPAPCPICGDRSAVIHSAYVPEVRCLIHGGKRLSEELAHELMEDES